MPAGTSKRTKSLHQLITREIAHIVISSEGDGLLPSEPKLGQHFGVSRTVLREAIKVLASKGLITLRPKVGMRINPRSQWNMLDPELLAWQCEVGPKPQFVRYLCETRLLVEPAIARFAALRATRQEIDDLERSYELMERTADSPDDFIAADMKFHATIAIACHNDILKQLGATIGGALRAMQEIVKYVPEGSRRTLPLHGEVAIAISRHDGAAARCAMERLVEMASGDIYRVLNLDHDQSV